MVRDEKFSIISVNTDDEDEFVIQAGIPQAVVVESSNSEELLEAQAKPKTQSASSVKKQKEAEVRYITTQEDLDDEGPMKNMRLLILGGALLLVVGFILYYFFLM